MAGETSEADPLEPHPADAAASAPAIRTLGSEHAPVSPGGTLLRGATVAPGLVLGKVHRKDHDLARVGLERVPLDRVDEELNRFRGALDESRRQLADLRRRLAGRVREEDARILDTHLTYLKDSVFIADVENLILNEQMRLDAAIAKVVGDFDRIFRLVRSDALRQSAVDLRDVGIRVLRNLERGAEDSAARAAPPSEYVLVAKELSIVDMFNLSNEHVKGIVTQEGGLTSHAAIFARSMRIPTLTGVERLLDTVREGDFVILDATEGILRVEPDEVVRSQYSSSAEEEGAPSGTATDAPEWAALPARTLDGLEIVVASSCGNLPEVEQGRALGMPSVGLYRTELLYLIDKAPPSREALVQHYSSVIGAAQGGPVTFRLLNVDSGMGIPYLHPEPARNPSLGSVGVRALLENPAVLRRQLQAFMLAALDAEARLALPFVTDCNDLRRVREILFEERLDLRKNAERFADALEVGVVVETPSSMLGIRDLAREADFLMLNLDSLQQYLLAVDREDAQRSGAIDVLHPFVLRALRKANEVAEMESRPLWVFGQASRRPRNLALLVGIGLRRFCVPPGDLRAFLGAVEAIDGEKARREALVAARGSSVEDASSAMADFRHGYAR